MENIRQLRKTMSAALLAVSLAFGPADAAMSRNAEAEDAPAIEKSDEALHRLDRAPGGENHSELSLTAAARMGEEDSRDDATPAPSARQRSNHDSEESHPADRVDDPTSTTRRTASQNEPAPVPLPAAGLLLAAGLAALPFARRLRG